MKLNLRVILMLLAFSSVAKAEELRFSHFGAEQGMAQIGLWGVTQDGDGNIWMIGEREVCCYDGFDVKTFSKSAVDGGNLPSALVKNTAVDSKGRLWLSMDQRVCRYDADEGRFIPSKLLPVPGQIFYIEEKCPGVMLLATYRDIFEYDEETEECKVFFRLSDEGDQIASFYKDEASNMYIGTLKGELYKLNDDGEARFIIKLRESAQAIISSREVEKTAWVGTKGGGLYLVDCLKGTILRRYTRGDNDTSLVSNQVRALEYATDGKLWVGTLLGLDIIDTGEWKVEHHLKNDFDQYSLSHNTIRCIFRDCQGGMWVGTYFGGLNYWHPERAAFSYLRPRHEGNSLNDDIVSCIVESEDGFIWIGTNKGGVNKYNPSTGEFKYYKVSISGEQDLEFNDIKSILVEDNLIYIGAHGAGMSVLDRKTNRIERKKSPYSVYSLANAGEGKIWVGATTGLYIFDIGKGDYRKCKEVRSAKVSSMLAMPQKKRLWISLPESVVLFDVKEDGSLNDITPSCLEDLQGCCDIYSCGDSLIFFSTSSGLVSYSDEGDSLSRIDKSCGLPSNDVNGVEMDQKGRLWISTKQGLCCRNLESGEMMTFDSGNGLINDVLLEYSHCRLRSGKMMFGGIGGVNIFSPDDIAETFYFPEPEISGLMVKGKNVIPGDDSHILMKAMSKTDAICLKYDQNHVTFIFSAANFAKAPSLSFSYRLDGFDSEWYVAGADRCATYSNLPKGVYYLHVATVDKEGCRVESSRVLEVKVLPVWYKSTVAILCWIVLGCTILAFSVWFVIYQKERGLMPMKGDFFLQRMLNTSFYPNEFTSYLHN